jgi:hypothetical protein
MVSETYVRGSIPKLFLVRGITVVENTVQDVKFIIG